MQFISALPMSASCNFQNDIKSVLKSRNITVKGNKVISFLISCVSALIDWVLELYCLTMSMSIHPQTSKVWCLIQNL